MSLHGRVRMLILAEALTLGATLLMSAPAVAGHLFGGSFAEEGSRAGQVLAPRGIAVDDATGDVYVADTENNRIDEFTASGTFVRAWGFGVLDGKAELEICTSTCQAGAPGGGEGQFFEPHGVAVDQTSGDVYVADTENNRIEKFDSEGSYLAQFNGGETPQGFMRPWGIAVGGSSDVYVADVESNAVDEFDAEGKYIAGSQLSSAGLTNLRGVAVNSEGDVYAANRFQPEGVVELNAKNELIGGIASESAEGIPGAVAVDQTTNQAYVLQGASEAAKAVGEYDSDNALLSKFGSENGLVESTGIAVNSSTEEVYVADYGANKIDFFAPLVLPKARTAPAHGVTDTHATLVGTVEPKGIKASYHFEYEALGAAKAADTSVEESESASAVPVEAPVSDLIPGSAYRYRLIAKNENGEVAGPYQTFTTLPRVDQAGYAADLTPSSATLSATVEQGNVSTAYHFVYGPTSAYGARVPEADLYTHTGGTETVSQVVSGLQPGTTYHFALVATNSSGAIIGEDVVFTTPSVTPPAVLTGGSSEVSFESASVSGVIDPRGLATTYEWELMSPTAPQSTTSCPTSEAEARASGPETRTLFNAGSGSSEVPLTMRFTNLAPATSYHYRLVAFNEDGISCGQDQVLTTVAHPLPPIFTAFFPSTQQLTARPEEQQAKPEATAKRKTSKRSKKKKKKKKEKKKKKRRRQNK